MRIRALALLGLLGSTAALVGCPSEPQPFVDAAVLDAPVFTPSELFGPCELDAQCPGEGAHCRRALDGFPGGSCTVACTDRTPCAGLGTANNQCVDLGDGATCEVGCLNSRDCRAGYACMPDVNPAGGVCIPLCSDDAQCGGGAVCDVYSGRCVAPGGESTAGLVGEPCASNEECRGWCITQARSNWPGGSCTANCALAFGWNTNTFFEGTTLPSGTCPGNDVCFPNGSFASGDLGLCLDGCTSNDECRDGYVCRKGFQLRDGGPTFSYDNGVCWPAG